jgi:trans-AT polyketide synthase/acyltransferase/oxidoreductase domain-containing protein
MADAIAFQGEHIQLAELLALRDNQPGTATSHVLIGSAREIGSPHSIAAAFINGAEFVLSDIVQQCTFESGLHTEAKALLQSAGTNDIKIAPCAELFEFGRTTPVLAKGSVFASKAKRLYELWREHETLETLSDEERALLVRDYFPEGIDAAIDEVRAHTPLRAKTTSVTADPKAEWAQLVKHYLKSASRQDRTRSDWRIACGAAMASLNTWLNSEKFVPWQERHVDQLALQLLQAAQNLLNVRVTH